MLWRELLYPMGETKELLELGHTAGNKPLSEQLVILGFAKAYDVIIHEASNVIISAPECLNPSNVFIILSPPNNQAHDLTASLPI